VRTFRLENGPAVYMDGTADYQLRTDDQLGIRAQVKMLRGDAEDLKVQLALVPALEKLLARYRTYAGGMLVDEEYTSGSIGDDAEMLAYVQVVGDLEEALKKEEK